MQRLAGPVAIAGGSLQATGHAVQIVVGARVTALNGPEILIPPEPPHGTIYKQVG